MFGFFKKKNKEDSKNKALKVRKSQRRKVESDRRNDIRWEPEKDNRRVNKERRKGVGAWDEHDK
jgi:hypothetical protein